MLKPLQQFICDTCGEVIERREDGWIEWISDRESGLCHSFRITHAKPASPNKASEEGCYQHGDEYGRSDSHLHNFMDYTLINLLFFLDVGEYHDKDYTGPTVKDMREFVELFRRLTLPYYEESRQYSKIAQQDGYYDEANELCLYTEEFLKGMIQKYGAE